MQEVTAFAGLKPIGLWRHFAVIPGIPRPSGNGSHISAYISVLGKRARLSAQEGRSWQSLCPCTRATRSERLTRGCIARTPGHGL